MLKHKFLFLLLAIASVSIHWSPSPEAAKNITLTVNYKVLNTEEGYDHLTKIIVYIDGKKAGESKEQVQSKGGNVTVPISKGRHDVKAMLMAYYEGVWEERTSDNNYTYDCFVELNDNFNKSKKLSIVFDLDKEMTYKFK